MKKPIATLQKATEAEAEAFDSIAIKQYPVATNFFWITHTCDRLHPTEMATSHLFNALKMIWNNSVPERMKIPPVREWGGIPKMDRAYRKAAVANLFNELMNRPDRTRGMEQALRTMAKHVAEKGYLPKRNEK